MFNRILFALALSVLSFAAPVSSGSAVAQPRYAQEPGGIQPLDRLLPGIRSAHPGKFYDAEGPTYGPSGDPHYHLKWMTPEGRVIWFDADARNGRVLRQSRGRDSFDNGPPGYARPYMDRQPYTADPYDGGYGRMRERERYAPSFVPGPRYGNGGGWRGRDGGGNGRGFGGRGEGRGDGGRGDGGGRGGGRGHNR